MRWPEVIIDIPVGAWRAIKFFANELGDWAFHVPQAASRHELDGS